MITKAKTGFVVTYKDTDLKVLIPYKATGYNKNVDLKSMHNEYSTVESFIYHMAEAGSGVGKVLKKATYNIYGVIK